MFFCRHFLQSISRPLVQHGLAQSWGWSLKLSGGVAIALTTLLSAPLVAQAYTARVTLFVTRDNNESYETFLRQCEAIARAGVQRSFDADVLTSEVILTIVGENQGLALPIMEVDVTRAEWQERPDPEYWARYYNNASTLLDDNASPLEL
ncbi:MAG: hypothetical protein AAF609_11850 [Cyanobacteria bacterium P01_C01_bin.120]